jgi:hypothetical protein
MAHPPLINGKEVGLLQALGVGTDLRRQAAAIHACTPLKRYGHMISNSSEAETPLS